MANLIYIKIDVTKIDKARLFEGRNGAKYLDLVCVPTSNSQYGDTHFITQSCSKEERQAGKKMPIIGNAKEQPPRQQRSDSTPFDGQKAPPPRSSNPPPAEDTEDVPF
jgi:hypothetical protein